MIIMWGWKVRFKTLSNGVFFCGSCGGDRQYARKQGRRWFTLFFIPIIPLDHVGDEFVECDTCHQGYQLSVLSMPTSATLSETLLAATRDAVVWLLRATTPGPATTATALELLSTTAGMSWSEQALQADVAGLDVSGLFNRLATLADAINEHGKESFLGGCVRLAVADGTLTDDERKLLDHIAASLRMTPAHARGVITQVGEQAGL
jgi:Tellurite resistance protein TerB